MNVVLKLLTDRVHNLKVEKKGWEKQGDNDIVKKINTEISEIESYIENLKSEKTPFTEEEQEIMDLIVSAYNKFSELKAMHPSDTPDFISGIHKCQDVLKGRVVTRDYPDVFYNMNNDDN